jgi:nitrite reductase/ring-hydroxylating ferredoxin subunit
MAFVKVYSLAQLSPASLVEVVVGDMPIALCNSGGEIRAIGGLCPHRNGPLGQGALHEKNVVCPWHAWEFSCVTGRHDFDPDIRVPVYPVRVDGDDILVDPCA